MIGFPLVVDLAGRRVLVVGAGVVGTRKVQRLLAADAIVRVVSPEVSAEIEGFAVTGRVELSKREFRSSDIDRDWLVVAATDNPAMNIVISNACADQQTWCVNVSSANEGTAATPGAIALPDAGLISVYGGGDPVRATAIRDLLALLLDLGALPTAPMRGVAKESQGRVALVGAGPGDPSLLTLRAVEAIRQANVLVVDRLAPVALWERDANRARIIDVGKAPGRHAASQEEINEILVSGAQGGNVVARIKGGDPLVLGRGGEEAAACLAAGIPVEVIPGITSAIAVPGAAGIPVTHRGVSSSFVVASAHEGPTGVLRAAADAPHSTTLVLLLGASQLPAIARALMKSGRDPSTPVAVVESRWTPRQRVSVTHLGEAGTGSVQVSPPAVVIVGEVVRFRDQLGDLGHASEKSGHA